MKISMLLVLLGLVPYLANAGVVERRRETQTEYDQDSVALNQQGACRSYAVSDLGLNAKSLSTCQGKCGDLAKQDAKNGKTSSVTCLGSPVKGIPTYTDPDGHDYIIGECLCDIPILDDIIQDVLMALPAIAEIGCEILFDSLDLVLEVGAAAIPGEGEAMDAGMSAAVKAAKTIDENGQDASGFLQWFADPCHSSNYTQMVDQIFDPLSNVPDSVIKGNGCKKTCPPKKPKPSVPTKTDKPKDTAVLPSASTANSENTIPSSSAKLTSNTKSTTTTALAEKSSSAKTSNTAEPASTTKGTTKASSSVTKHTTAMSTSFITYSSSKEHKSTPSSSSSSNSTSTAPTNGTSTLYSTGGPAVPSTGFASITSNLTSGSS